ncbi:MAG: oligopeptide/dipeptide ABC transporter ATP-binding protein [Rectinema subterraneum]|uniref:oligopeptide/dipeptide ABC transporter ATP-binding protein n=1 Tax=Rectinema subterraneum TaxID=2653714 RepID=UPI003C7D12C7
MEDLIRCMHVTKIHRARGLGGLKRGFKALDDISLSIQAQGSFGLVGESGCGKTTFARAIMFLDPPTSGSVRFQNVALESLNQAELRKFRKKMQIVFQDPNSALDPKMSIYHSLSEGMINFGVQKEARDKKIKNLLDMVGISHTYIDRFPHEFSGGQKQRIVIARALSMDPDFLVLDEPVSNLDVSIQAQIINLLSDLKEEFRLTYLFISHDLNLVSYMCDTIGVMFKGRIVEQGNADRIMSNPAHPYTRRLLASIPGSLQRLDLPHSDQIELDPEIIKARESDKQFLMGCQYYPYCPLADAECAMSAPSLKELSGGHVVSCFKFGAGI